MAFANGFGIDTSSDLLSSQTNSRHHPDTLRQCLINTTQTPPVICKNIGHWKERQYLSFMTFYNILQRHLELIHRRHPDTPSRHHPDAIQTPPDTIQTPSDIFMQFIFMQYRALYIGQVTSIAFKRLSLGVSGMCRGVWMVSESV